MPSGLMASMLRPLQRWRRREDDWACSCRSVQGEAGPRARSCSMERVEQGFTARATSAKRARGSGISIAGILRPIWAVSSSITHHDTPLFALISAIRSCSMVEPPLEPCTTFNPQSDLGTGFEPRRQSVATVERLGPGIWQEKAAGAAYVASRLSIFRVSGCGEDYRRDTSNSRIHPGQSYVCRQVPRRCVRRPAD